MNFYLDIFRSREPIILGLYNTLWATIFAIILGSCIGILLGVLLKYSHKTIRVPVRLFVDIIRGMPGLVTIFSVFYMITFILQAWEIEASSLVIGTLALTLPCSVQLAEITRGALQNIPKGQVEAGKAIGLRFYQIFFSVLLPQTLVQMLPPWMNVATEVVKGTTLLMLIGIPELLLTAQQLIARNGDALSYYIFVGIIYFLINTSIELGGKKIERKLSVFRNFKNA